MELNLKQYNFSNDEVLKINSYYDKLIATNDEELIISNMATFNLALEQYLGIDVAILALIKDVLLNEDDEFIKLKNLYQETLKIEIEDACDDETNLMDVNTYDDYRNLFIIKSGDYRVILVSIIERLSFMRRFKKEGIKNKENYARVSLEIHAKLAHRLGLSKIKTELEELSLYWLDINSFKKVVKSLELKKEQRDLVVKNTCIELTKAIKLPESSFEVYGRSKSIYSIYTKTLLKNREIDTIYDLFGIRILCNTIEDCIKIQSYITTKYKFIGNRYKDYISYPKPNGYRSLHIALEDEQGNIFEVQIRTYQMHKEAEIGFASHWSYKESGHKNNMNVENKIHLFRDIINNEPNKEMDIDVFSMNIFVYTPRGKIIIMPAGATIIDFAYRIHSNIAQTMVGATANNKIVPFNYVLKNGDTISILRKKNISAPKSEWLDICVTNHARKKIKNYLQKEKDNLILEYSKKGENMLDDYLFELNYQGDRSVAIEKLMRFFSQTRQARFFMKVATQEITYAEISQVLEPKAEKDLKIIGKSDKLNEDMIMIKGAEGIKKNLSLCCYPIPGDEIIGITETGKSIKIHRVECSNIVKVEENKKFIAHWNYRLNERTKYDVNLTVFAESFTAANTQIMAVFIKHNIDVRKLVTQQSSNLTKFKFVVAVKNLDKLNDTISSLKNINGIIDVKRV